MRRELRADCECLIILCVTHLFWPIYACVSCLLSMCFHCYFLNICCFIPNEHFKTRKCFVRPQYLTSPQESGAAGFSRPNGRQGVTKCRAPDHTNKCRHPFRVQTAWAQSPKKFLLEIKKSVFFKPNVNTYLTTTSFNPRDNCRVIILSHKYILSSSTSLSSHSHSPLNQKPTKREAKYRRGKKGRLYLSDKIWILYFKRDL